MIIGHYAAALVPHQRDAKTPVIFYLVMANALDLLWLVFAVGGLEAPEPNSLWKASFANLQVDMHYSHDLLPVAGWAALAAGVAFAVFRRAAPAIWSALLILMHEAADILSGFTHHVAGADTPAVGFNLYGRAPETALIVEAVFGAALTAWYVNARKKEGRPVSEKVVAGLYAAFILGALMWLPIARTPLAEWFG